MTRTSKRTLTMKTRRCRSCNNSKSLSHASLELSFWDLVQRYTSSTQVNLSLRHQVPYSGIDQPFHSSSSSHLPPFDSIENLQQERRETEESPPSDNPTDETSHHSNKKNTPLREPLHPNSTRTVKVQYVQYWVYWGILGISHPPFRPPSIHRPFRYSYTVPYPSLPITQIISQFSLGLTVDFFFFFSVFLKI